MLATMTGQCRMKVMGAMGLMAGDQNIVSELSQKGGSVVVALTLKN